MLGKQGRPVFAQRTQGKLHPGEQGVGGEGRSRERLKGALLYLSACPCCKRLLGSFQRCCCSVAFANTIFKSKGGREKQIDGNLFCLKKNPLDLVMP